MQIEVSGKELRELTGWTEIGFVPDTDTCVVHEGRYVLWTDEKGVAQNLGTLSREEHQELVGTKLAEEESCTQ